MWVPSHYGIPGKEKVDAAAKAAANHPLPTKSELTLFARRIIYHHWSTIGCDEDGLTVGERGFEGGRGVEMGTLAKSNPSF